MKVRKGVELKYVYLYRDGHAVAVFSERHKTSCTDVEWAEVYEKFIEDGGLAFHPGGEYGAEKPEMNGRVILRGRLAVLVSKAREVRVWRDNGSQKSRAAGLAIQTLSVELKDGGFSVTHLPDLLSSEFEYQDAGWGGEKIGATFAETTSPERHGRWSDYSIAKVHKVTDATVTA